MFTDYIAMKKGQVAYNSVSPTPQKQVEENLATLQPISIQKHKFDRKDPWNWKFPQRCDTMSQSTLSEERDLVRIYSIKKLKTSRNHSLNLLSTDINCK